ncbi:hypothetical protein [Brevundimonas sp.]
MRNEQPVRPTPPPVLPDPPRGAGLYGEVAPLPISRIVPPPLGEGRSFL